MFILLLAKNMIEYSISLFSMKCLQGIRILDNELVKTVENKENNVSKIYALYLKIGHISLLAKDFPRGNSVCFFKMFYKYKMQGRDRLCCAYVFEPTAVV